MINSGISSSSYIGQLILLPLTYCTWRMVYSHTAYFSQQASISSAHDQVVGWRKHRAHALVRPPDLLAYTCLVLFQVLTESMSTVFTGAAQIASLYAFVLFVRHLPII